MDYSQAGYVRMYGIGSCSNSKINKKYSAPLRWQMESDGNKSFAILDVRINIVLNWNVYLMYHYQIVGNKCEASQCVKY